MKRIIAIFLLFLIITTSFTACSENNNESNDEGKYRIGIFQAQNHPSLDEIREYIIIGFEELGMKDKIEIIYKDAQSDASNVNTIASQFIGDNVDMIIPIATGAAQAAAAQTTEIPIVFAAVSYPVESGLVEDISITDKNITGVTNAIAVEEIFELSKTITPDIKKYGFIYNAGEVNSASNMERAKSYCDKNGFEYVESTITNSGELLQAVQVLIQKDVDAIFCPNDNTVAMAMPTLASEAINAKVPVYVGADSMVKEGALVTVGIDYKVLGRQVAAMATRIIEGESIKDNPIEVINEYSKIINEKTLESLEIIVDENILNKLKIIK